MSEPEVRRRPDRGRPVEPTIIDPDVDLSDPAQRLADPARQWDLIAVTAVGGVLGAEARYGLGSVLPHHDQQFPWSTLLINVTGCLLIGVLMAVLLELPSPHRLARPFLGVGVLGGYTTYSTFAVEVQRLVLHHRPLVALDYAVLTVLGCTCAVWLSSTLTGRTVAAARR
ncbi:fluoride efflux transporter CrcB [Jatrophihabitans sp.]|uniref:fluoride efflux transporter CrcB n=1 Tax=Jatrophihabitans sp. TaxID=1932789 RepID=UPI002F1AD279